MLEPRRLAARAAGAVHGAVTRRGGRAAPSATACGWTRGSAPRTRIEVVTEGILTRHAQHDPALEGVGLVIFDEFHERSLHADLGPGARARDPGDPARPTSASSSCRPRSTGQRVSRLLGDAPVVTSVGRSHPGRDPLRAGAGGRPDRGRAWRAPSATRWRDDAGDVLVFLPGAGEIRRVEELLAGA